MRCRSTFVVGCLLTGALTACSSDSPVNGLDAGAVDASDTGAAHRDSGATNVPDAGMANFPDGATVDSGDPSTEAGLDATSLRNDASQPIGDASANGDASPRSVDASADCVMYCTCMATNCMGEVFANGCLYECATQTNWDLPCRANMCGLVPMQPGNEHCTHAFGMIQCLNR